MSELETLLQDWNKLSKARIARQGGEVERLSRIPYSSVSLNYQSYGGLPRKKVVEFFGPEGSGKTTTALDVVGNAQRVFYDEWEEQLAKAKQELADAEKAKKGKATISLLKEELKKLEKPKQVVYVDLENTLDLEWAELLGVDVDDLWLIVPEQDSAEVVLQYVIDICKTGEVGMVVLDSLPYLVSQQIIEQDLEKKMYGGIAGVMTDFIRKVTPYVTKHNMVLLGINQVRENMESAYIAYNTPGGKMWKHACSVRMRFRKGKYVDLKGNELPNNTSNPAGNKVECFVEKTKAFKPDRKLATYQINYVDGIQIEQDLIEVAIQYGFIQKSGAWFTVIDTETGEIMEDSEGNELKVQGMTNLASILKKDDDIFDYLMTSVHMQLV